jgi:lysophospholipase L1-like esterase
MNRFFNLLRSKIELKVPIGLIFVFVLLLYAGWEGYWYTQVGLRMVKWHIHLAVYLYVWAAGVFVFWLTNRSASSERGSNIFLLFTSVVFSLLLLESFFQLSGINKTYLEKISGFYDSSYTPQDNDYYHCWTPANKEHYITKPEYSYWRPTNSLGFGDVEWPVAKKLNEKRILALGDSFTEGDGAPYDSTFVSLLKNKLLNAGDTFYTMNAGVCGSDPFHNYIFLKNKLLVYRPDLVIQVLASHDLNFDIILRGGMERFQKDGTQKYARAPWWEPLYAVSYISRIFFKRAGYNDMLRKGNLTVQETDKLNRDVSGLFGTYSALCKSNHIAMVVVLRPDKDEILNNKYNYDFTSILDSLKADSHIIFVDLLPFYRAYIEKTKTDVGDYFWKADGHHNAPGYEMMAQGIFENIRPLLNDTIALHQENNVLNLSY